MHSTLVHRVRGTRTWINVLQQQQSGRPCTCVQFVQEKRHPRLKTFFKNRRRKTTLARTSFVISGHNKHCNQKQRARLNGQRTVSEHTRKQLETGVHTLSKKRQDDTDKGYVHVLRW